MKPLCYLNTSKGNAETMVGAFAQGSGAEVTKKLEFVPERPAVFWGVDRATLPVWRKVVETKTPYYYVDNGYFKSKWQGGDHYRITRDAEQCSGLGRTSGERWRELGLEIKPWRTDGRHILVACQSDFWHERHGDVSAESFSDNIVSALRAVTSRPVVVRGKPIGAHKEPPLASHLEDCWAVITHSSMVGAEALLAGIPIVSVAPCALAPMSGTLAAIESPRYADGREVWASVLADNQWRLAEISGGIAWRSLHGMHA